MQYNATEYTNVGTIQGICPNGWHIPTESKFQVLVTETGSSGAELRTINQGRDSFAGTNSSGFSALLGGARNPNSGFGVYDLSANFWSTSENIIDNTKATSMYIWAGGVGEAGMSDFSTKNYGYSVRCLKD